MPERMGWRGFARGSARPDDDVAPGAKVMKYFNPGFVLDMIRGPQSLLRIIRIHSY
ncbi:hypothetical protein M408DRAFT_25531 [Serendipita vermifera MAFF 305830]|uniref:Uncharacterized protein n=1 Tax=Serendipita vermifera MAFF 305830 TaxID=933852 RepID=A0A0C3B4B3_SERVB|nr:hypothetical protein M408DRAFT_25531 [Serendipita vermifera MAFF 305830]